MVNAILITSVLFALANLAVMLVMNVYNLVDTIRMNRERREAQKELDKMMKDTLVKLESTIKDKNEEEE